MPKKFINYGKIDSANHTEFSSYVEDSSIIMSGFTGYRESGTDQNDSFKWYDQSANNPHNNFKSYVGCNAGFGFRVVLLKENEEEEEGWVVEMLGLDLGFDGWR
ncbi:hypothetical protein L3X38_005035 [Prunus dulcis]|uniref:Uncharacterized protein n=1 Tax=Prunus dulcis TaxID=3755 RepID=A0AAD5F3R5_PRUDU|nr:hypothetical protein L3X38_005035 [Prunus dulcis]